MTHVAARVAFALVLTAHFEVRAANTIGTTALSPATAAVGVAADVLVTSVITEPGVIASTVNLQRIDASGRVLATQGVLHDDGREGDAVSGDRTFSLRFVVYENSPGPLTFRVSAGFQGSLTRVFSPPMTFNVSGTTATGITITSPANFEFLNTSPIIVRGTTGDPAATVTINGVNATRSGTSYQASIPLVEGTNTLTAVARNAGGTTSTANVQVTLDTTPPKVTIDTPAAGLVTTESSVTVAGIVNDIVVGTVNDQQAAVTVNGVAATVANRTYTAANVPLQPGNNVVTALARDRTGNSSSVQVTIRREASTQPAIRAFSGSNQSGTVGTALAAPLVAVVTNGAGQPVPNVPVIFKVTENDGFLQPGTGKPQSIVVNTNTQGRAQAQFTLGMRAGAGANIVEATAAGYAGVASFAAAGLPQAAAKINVDSGMNQTGTINQNLAFPFVAVVTDAGHNRIRGVSVTFSVKQGGGTINGNPTYTTVTDGDGRALALLKLGMQPGFDNNVIEASFPGNPSFPAAFTASAKAPGNPTLTKITGVVLDNSNNPIPNVTMRLFKTNQANSNNQPVQIGTPVLTNTQGQFTINSAPVGFFKLMADGTTSTQSGKSYPTLEYDIVTVAGQDNTVGSPIYLPALDPTAKLCVNETTGGTLKLSLSPGFELTVAPGSATFPGGSRSGCITVTPVNPDKVPMVPGFGQQPRFVVTIQPVGTMFNPPAQIKIPNVDGLLPRAKTEMYSYDHDLAAFVAIGSATVSDDGAVIASDPGVGVLKAGWHCGGNPNPTGSAGTCPECQRCVGTDCQPDNSKTPAQLSTTDCKKQECSGGSVTTRNDDSEQPPEVCKECRNGSPADRPNGSTPADPLQCCFDGKPLSKYDNTYSDTINKCPNRSQREQSGPTGRPHEIDGCSGGLTSNIQDPINGRYGASSLAVASTVFGVPQGIIASAGVALPLPCNQHDICYQTCRSDRKVCDDGMEARMNGVCDRAYPSTCPTGYSTLQCAGYFVQRTDCYTFSNLYWSGLRVGGGSAYEERQSQYCKCCN